MLAYCEGKIERLMSLDPTFQSSHVTGESIAQWDLDRDNADEDDDFDFDDHLDELRMSESSSDHSSDYEDDLSVGSGYSTSTSSLHLLSERIPIPLV